MLEKLMPKSDEFFDDFDQQCQATVEGARLLRELLTSFVDVAAKTRAIKAVEHRGDEITRRAFERLHRQFITPFDRAEIHRLLSRIDDVLDMVDGAASRLGYYDIHASTPEAAALAGVLERTTLKVQEVVRALRFVKQPEQILAGCQEIQKLEEEADEITRAAVGHLFKPGADPLHVIKWKELYDLIEGATDRCLDVANVIQGVVLEHA